MEFYKKDLTNMNYRWCRYFFAYEITSNRHTIYMQVCIPMFLSPLYVLMKFKQRTFHISTSYCQPQSANLDLCIVTKPLGDKTDAI